MKFELPPKAQLTGEAPNRTLTITIYAPTPSVNKWTFAHWTKYRAIKKIWTQRIFLACALKPKTHFKRAEIKVLRYARRLLDPENAAAGVKPITDALVEYGILTDDSLKYLLAAPEVTQKKILGKGLVERSIITVIERETYDRQERSNDIIRRRESAPTENLG